MKTYDEMVNSLLERRDEFLAEQRQRRRTAAKIYTAGGSCAVAAAIGVGVLNSGMLRDKNAIAPNSSAISDSSFAASDEQGNSTVQIPVSPTAPDFSSVIWAEEGKGGIPSDDVGASSVEQDFMRQYWNGKEIYRSLYNAFEEHGDDTVFAIAARCNPYDENFVYNGKTLAQYEAEEKELWERYDSLYVLLKIIYYKEEDEALHGDKNSAYYDQQISELPEDIRKEYIVDGVFLKDKAEKDMNDTWEKFYVAQVAYEQARCAYRAYIVKTAAEQITAQGIYCEMMYSFDSPYSLIIFATKDEFAELTFDGMQKWYFALAEKRSDGDGYFVSEIVDC